MRANFTWPACILYAAGTVGATFLFPVDTAVSSSPSLAPGFSNGRSGGWSPAPNSTDETKAAVLLEVLGGKELIKKLLATSIEPIREALPELEASWWDRFLERADLDELVRRTAPIYAERLSEAEIDALIQFYRTPQGQSILQKLPGITEDAMLVGQTWILEEIQRMLRQLEAEGHEIPADLEI